MKSPEISPHNEKVTVIIPAYNAATTLVPTLNSLRDQTFSNLEILIVDDASTDETLALIEHASAADERVRCIRHVTNQGRSAARNSGIDAASGDWIGFVDADDLWDPTRVEKLIDSSHKYPNSDVITSDHLKFSQSESDGSVRVAHWFPTTNTLRSGVTHEMDLTVWFRDRATMMQPFVRRSFLLELGARYPVGLSVGEDNIFNMMVAFADNARPLRVGEPLSYYREHGTSRASGSAENLVRGVELALDVNHSFELRKLASKHLGSLCWIRERGEALLDDDRLAERDVSSTPESSDNPREDRVRVPIDKYRGALSLARSKVLQELSMRKYRSTLLDKQRMIESLLTHTER